MHFVLSGSSLLNLNDGQADLSRRCVPYSMPGLSFREYLAMFQGKEFKIRTLSEILTDGNHICAEVNTQLHPLPLFNEYLKYGYYPFLNEGKNNYYIRVEIPNREELNNQIVMVRLGEWNVKGDALEGELI